MHWLTGWMIFTASLSTVTSCSNGEWTGRGCDSRVNQICKLAVSVCNVGTFYMYKGSTTKNRLLRCRYDVATENVTIDYYPLGETWNFYYSYMRDTDKGLDIWIAKVATEDDSGTYSFGTETQIKFSLQAYVYKAYGEPNPPEDLIEDEDWM